MKYRILIEQDEDGMFVAECPSLPGCVSQGRTWQEAVEHIQDAIRGYVESLKKHNEPLPTWFLVIPSAIPPHPLA
ncbi:MAG TPA: type II toxin-antitoxin system HicB family antitoxin [Syntrophobacteria bacterium]|nr:type II toxin-antitoxin system HicB family antitoxin [Syntrophobacteria bacterium]